VVTSSRQGNSAGLRRKDCYFFLPKALFDRYFIRDGAANTQHYFRNLGG